VVLCVVGDTGAGDSRGRGEVGGREEGTGEVGGRDTGEGGRSRCNCISVLLE